MRNICTIEGCGGVVNGHGYCNKHYLRWKKYGDPLGGRRNHASPSERFDRRVEKGPDCWLWTGGKAPNGYGRFQVGGKGSEYVGAHRFSFERANGISPQVVMHTCDNPACVNPAHLKAGTYKENTADMIAKGRNKRKGPQGVNHPKAKLSEEQVRNIRLIEGRTAYNVAKEYGVDGAVIRRIWRREIWKHLE